MNYKILLFFLVSNVVCFASLLDLSVPYLENSEQKAVVHHVTKSIQTSLNGRVSTQYWRYLNDGQADCDCLVAASQDHTAARPLGLVADDVKQIEDFVETFRTTEPSISGPVSIKSLRFAVQALPAFLAKNYENITQQVIDEIIADDYYAYLGPKLDSAADGRKILEAKTTRALAAEYLFQKWNRCKREPRHYFFLLKNSNPTEQEKFKKFCMSTITEPLGELANKVEYIDNINDSDVTLDVGHNVINYSQLQYIFVRVQGNLKDNVVIKKIENIMKLGPLNSELQAVILFDDSTTEIPDAIRMHLVENISFFGKNVEKIGYSFLSGFRSLKKIDLTDLSNVTEIGSCFLSGCISLKEIDLSPLSKVKEVGAAFLSDCNCLKEVDLTPLSNVQKVQGCFLKRCNNLERVIIPKQLYDLLVYNYSSIFKHFPKLTEENIILKDGDRSISLKDYNASLEDDNASFYCAIQ